MEVGRRQKKRKLVFTEDDNDGDQGGHSDALYRFKVLLPNGTAVGLQVPVEPETPDMPLEQFILLVKGVYFELRKQQHQQGQVDWKSPRLFLQDADDRVIRQRLVFAKFRPDRCHILRLHDGSSNVRESYENMWDLTPDTDLLKELPEEYSFETALSDLIDNSLQAVWSQEGRRLISVDIKEDRISIFDTGSGMDDSDENSIVKWGKMGASLNRSWKAQAIGGKPPYLRPFFGMFGYGGPIASMYLGWCTIVSSKTKDSRKVYTLYLKREALRSSSSSATTWRTKGGMRDPSEDEIRKSPQGSFTKVQILDLRMKNLDQCHIRCRLKDIYFPYIQCDEASATGKTSTPIKFQVNGIDLAEIEGGEVSITNLHSCNGPNFIFQLLFSVNQDKATTKSPGRGGSSTANARLKCVYFPINEGKENIERILEKLEAEGIGTNENYETFSRVSIRRLGRLLPDARWACLPFMDLRQKKGEKAHLLKRCCLRVKCFVDADGGFNPTPSKTNLALHNPFTMSLKNFGCKMLEKETEVSVEISRDGKVLTPLQLEKEYQDWILKMHDQYDEETFCAEDEAVVVVGPTNKKKLGISSDIVRVHKILKRKGISWKSGQRIKVLKGACPGVHKNNVFATLEYFLIEGLPGDAGGEARLICRPLGLTDETGCKIAWNNGNASLDIRESISLPISVIDSGKCQAIGDPVWNLKLEKERQKGASAIDLLCDKDCQELEVDGALPADILDPGSSAPRAIIAVFRPASYSPSDTRESLDKKYIVKTNLQMSMEVKYRSKAKDYQTQNIYSAQVSPSSCKGFDGLYIFQLGCKFPNLFQNPGIYTFSFFANDPSCKSHEKSIIVKASSPVGKWKVLRANRIQKYNASVDSSFPPLCIACFDHRNNQIPVKSVPKVKVKLLADSDVLAQIDTVKAVLSSDGLTLQVKDLLIKTSHLDRIRPNYEATLVISDADEMVLLSIPCQVLPGSLQLVKTQAPAQHLLPGSVVKELRLEMFDAHGNHVMEGLEVQLIVNGFCFLGKTNSKQKVDENGYIDLSGLLKVTVGFGEVASVAAMFHDREIFKQEYQIDKMSPRMASRVCTAGSQLENSPFEAVNSEGVFDQTIQELPIQEHAGSIVLSIMDSQQALEQEIFGLGEQIRDCESELQKLNYKKEEVEQCISKLQASMQPVFSDNLHYLLTREELVERIKIRIQSAAGILCYLSRNFTFKEAQKHFMEDIIGVVALLGTVYTSKLSRMLSNYLGEDYMLAVVCRSYEAASALEKYDRNGDIDLELGLHAEAAALERSISDGFLVICLEDIRPYTGKLEGYPQKKLILPDPVLPNGQIPSGFMGYAVNMVELDACHLNTRTESGYGLRETLFYRLFGELQVYETREHVIAARDCVKHGAVSLDGGIWRENGITSLGNRDLDICFPVTSLDGGTQLLLEDGKQLQSKTEELEEIMMTIKKYTKLKERCHKKFWKKKKKCERWIDNMIRCEGLLQSNHHSSSGIHGRAD